ncbi:WXG100 family type VII secretion target [Nocardia altamirensis]|uniref:WXG100 family type VII secretion target n=1 Tax=Nocardia altamirensis TaxID=472158 RepID=UPI000A034111|nr:WXG100 family type VII secretion target [Nocardia altamirensis]
MSADTGRNAPELWAVPSEVADAGTFVRQASESLVNGLRSVDADVNRLLEFWQGGLSDSYRTGWEETRAAAMTVLESLATMAESLGVSSARYDRTDGANAQSLSSLDLPEQG